MSFCQPTETQARPLTTIDVELVGEVWQAVLDEAQKDDDGNPIITAKHVKAVVEELKVNNCLLLPASEFQARELTKLRTEDDDGNIAIDLDEPLVIKSQHFSDRIIFLFVKRSAAFSL